MNGFWDRINQWPARRWLILSLIFLALLYGYSIWHNQSILLADGHRAFWLHDDMMIAMRYGRNLAKGDGLVWNPGQPAVEGYSNLAWVLIMTAVHWLPIPETTTSLVILLINIFLVGLVLFLIYRLAYRLVPRPGVWLFPALITVAVIVDMARWTTIGLEVPLLTAVFLWLLTMVVDEAAVNRPRLSTFFLAGFLGLIRVDGPVLGVILCLTAFAFQRDKKRVIAYSPFILILPLIHVLFRLGYYGYPLPNTYYLKLSAWDARLVPGLRYLLRFVGLYWPLLLTALVGLFFAKDKRLMTLFLAGVPLATYAVFTGGDDFGGARFFAPWLPVLILVTFLVVGSVPWLKRPLMTNGFLAALTLLTGLTAGYRFYHGPSQEALFVETGLILEEATWPTSSIGVFWAGTLAYFAHRPAVDLLGKNDEVVARLPANEGSLKPGHNKFDFEYSLNEYQPDLIVSSLSLGIVSEPERFVSFVEGDDAYAGQLFLDSTFQQNYAPTLIYVEELPVFVLTDSAERERLIAQSECEAVTNEELLKYGLETVCWLNGR